MILQTSSGHMLALIQENAKASGPHPTADLFEPLPGQALQFHVSDHDTAPTAPVNDRT